MNIQGIVTPQAFAPAIAPGASSTFKNLHKLEKGLATDNINEARQAYAALEPTAPQGSGPAAQAFSALGQALQTGDLSGARSDLRSVLHAEGRMQRVRHDIGQIKDGLDSNNLDEAQAAFTALQAVVGQRNPTGQISQDLQSLGQALQTGDISTAQTAFSTYLQDLKSDRTAPPPAHLMHMDF